MEDEWPCILPILIKRIVLQYADITRYKKESLGRLEKPKELTKSIIWVKMNEKWKNSNSSDPF